MTLLHQISTDRPSSGRCFASILGYLVAMAGVLLVFSIPLYLSFLMLAAGAVIGRLAHYPVPPMTWRSWMILVGGCVIIVGVLSAFGQERISHWSPHPAGYVPAWFAVFHAVREIRYFFQHESHPETIA